MSMITEFINDIFSKENFKKILSKVKDLRFFLTLIQEVLYLLFNLIYGNKPLFTI